MNDGDTMIDVPRRRPPKRAPQPSVLDQSVEILELSVRSSNALRNAGIFTINELLQRTERDVLRLPNVGRLSLKEIKDTLARHGLQLKDQIDMPDPTPRPPPSLPPDFIGVVENDVPIPEPGSVWDKRRVPNSKLELVINVLDGLQVGQCIPFKSSNTYSTEAKMVRKAITALQKGVKRFVSRQYYEGQMRVWRIDDR